MAQTAFYRHTRHEMWKSCDTEATSSVEACQQARLSAHLSRMVPLKAHTLKRPKLREKPDRAGVSNLLSEKTLAGVDVRTDDRVQLAAGENATHAHAYRRHRTHRTMHNAFAR